MLLYPRNRPLKDLLLTAKNKGYNSIVATGWEYNSNEPIATEDFNEDSVAKRLYNAVTEYFYYADIASDSDEEFIKRFTNRWNIYSPEYIATLNKINDYTGDKETLSIDGTNTRNATKTTSNTASADIEETEENTLTMEKGVTTTSSQETSNTGNKLTRTTPNEQMSVEGDATTTVVDSGSDTDTKEGTFERSETHTNNGNETANDTLRVVTENVRSKLTAENISLIAKFNGIVREFVYLFENLFLEVLD